MFGSFGDMFIVVGVGGKLEANLEVCLIRRN